MEEKVIEEHSSVDMFGRMRHFNSDSISKAQNRGIAGLKECAEIFTGHALLSNYRDSEESCRR
jgi:hypothetical protein